MPDLPKRQLGRTGLQVTTLGYGAMELRGTPVGRDVSEEQAERILNAVLDAGINFIDTSIDYGVAEERIGRYISNRRDEYFLATKAGCLSGPLLDNPPPAEPGRRFPHVFTPENIVRGLEQSLSRMKTDHVDLLQFHASPSKAQLEEHGALDCVLDLQRQGKVRFIGMSGTIPNLNEQIEMGVFDEFQIPYSAMEREHEDLIAKASEAGAGVVIRGGAAKGQPGKEQGTAWDKWQQTDLSDLMDGMSRQEFILRFTITHPHMDTTIVGTINPDHLRDNIEALLHGPLPADVYAEAKRRLDTAGLHPIAIEAR
ncbi:MAG TPA: aldo/keto reductase [Dehalococcoidia bacterium]|jgi:aryl-alcohol dehydrogenase-like predicted oxidoreductase|nr:aldo/keto reductase [Dehalococcoidia bacterium]